jgi:hypothetical protein
MDSQEPKVCGGCSRVNPGGLKEVKEKILCYACRQELMFSHNIVNSEKFAHLEKVLEEQNIRRPTNKDIRIILDILSGQAGNYRRLFRARHPENYKPDITSKP